MEYFATNGTTQLRTSVADLWIRRPLTLRTSDIVIQPLPVGEHRIEKGCALGAILHRMRHDLHMVAGLEGCPIPTLAAHDVGSSALNVPGPYRGFVRSVGLHLHDDVCVWIFPTIIHYRSFVRHILSQFEHRKRMMRERRDYREQHACCKRLPFHRRNSFVITFPGPPINTWHVLHRSHCNRTLALRFLWARDSSEIRKCAPWRRFS